MQDLDPLDYVLLACPFLEAVQNRCGRREEFEIQSHSVSDHSVCGKIVDFDGMWRWRGGGGQFDIDVDLLVQLFLLELEKVEQETLVAAVLAD